MPNLLKKLNISFELARKMAGSSTLESQRNWRQRERSDPR
jgi:hypothetical protein